MIALFLASSLALAANTHRTPTVEQWAVDPHSTGVYLHDARAPLVTIQIQLPVGLEMETTREAGLREAWQLQASDPEGQLDDREARLGGQLRLLVYGQITTLEILCLAEDLPEVRELLIDILNNRAYSSAELFAERWELAGEWKRNHEHPLKVRTEAARKLAFAETDPRHPPASAYRPPVTDSEALATLRDQVLETPGRIVALAGDLTLEQAQAFATELLPPANPERQWTAPTYEALPERPARHVVPLEGISQAHLELFTLGLAAKDPSLPAWTVAHHVLGGHPNSRVTSTLRHGHGDTYSARGFSRRSHVPSRAGLVVSTRAQNADGAERRLVEVLQVFHAEGITEPELADAVHAVAHGQPPGWSHLDLAAVEALTLDEVNAVIGAHFDPADFTMVVVVPEK